MDIRLDLENYINKEWEKIKVKENYFFNLSDEELEIVEIKTKFSILIEFLSCELINKK